MKRIILYLSYNYFISKKEFFMDNIKIGKYISYKRKQKGLTQKELGEMLLMSDKAVSKWERMKRIILS